MALASASHAANMFFIGESTLDEPIPQYTERIARSLSDPQARAQFTLNVGTGHPTWFWDHHDELKGEDCWTALSGGTNKSFLLCVEWNAYAGDWPYYAAFYDLACTGKTVGRSATDPWGHTNTIGAVDPAGSGNSSTRLYLYQCYDDQPGPWETRNAQFMQWAESIRDALNRNLSYPDVYIVPNNLAIYNFKKDVEAVRATGFSSFSQLWADVGHLNQREGAYLMALLYYACFYNASPVGATGDMGSYTVPQATARYLQQLAWRTVTSYAPSGVSSTACRVSAPACVATHTQASGLHVTLPGRAAPGATWQVDSRQAIVSHDGMRIAGLRPAAR